MEFILLAVAFLGMLVTVGFAVACVLAYAYFNPQSKWPRRLFYWTIFVFAWVFMNSI